uniref:Asparagine synthetase domain-containing protein n=1 Tax=Rhabditophanes sp. KR3021 TaxID=114890 RepID=A0AC35TV65_9BILA
MDSVHDKVHIHAKYTNDFIIMAPDKPRKKFDLSNLIDKDFSEQITKIYNWKTFSFTLILKNKDSIVFAKDPIGKYSLLISFKVKGNLEIAFNLTEQDKGSFVEVPAGSVWRVSLNNENKLQFEVRSVNPLQFMNTTWTRDLLNCQYFKHPVSDVYMVARESSREKHNIQPMATKFDYFLKNVYKECGFGDHRSMGIMFSGGVDSVAIAISFIKFCNIDVRIYLVNVGVLNEFGVVTAPDRVRAITAFEEIIKLYPVRSITLVCRDLTLSEINEAKPIIHIAQRPKSTKMDESISLVLYFAFQAKGYNYVDKKPIQAECPIMLAGSGADELFGGYMKHRQIYDIKKNYLEIAEALQRELYFLGERNHGRDSRIVEHFQTAEAPRQLISPFLTYGFIEFAVKIPVNFKSDYELPRGQGEKHILRMYLKSCKLSKEVYEQPKQAMQFGSRIGLYEKASDKGTDEIEYFQQFDDNKALDYLKEAIEEKLITVV